MRGADSGTGTEVVVKAGEEVTSFGMSLIVRK
jgi:hypothetical protein